jgi:hypothetical protein
MEPVQTPRGGRKVAIPIPMAHDDAPAGSSVECPSCGHVQDRTRSKCSLCGFTLDAPGMIYKRQADGTWTVLKGIDIASLAPRPRKRPQRYLSRQVMGLIALALLILAVCSIWAWRERRMGANAEAWETFQYAAHPVGTIVPQFRLQIQRGDAGDLWVTGGCNLPTDTQLEIRVFADDTVVAIDYPVIVSGSRFQTRPLLDKGRPFTSGSFQIRVKGEFSGRSQPPAVLAVVGTLGQRLQGPLVQKREVTTGATVTYTEAYTIN